MESAAKNLEQGKEESAAITCPVCGSNDLSLLISQPASKHLKLDRVFEIQRCNSCEAGFVSNPPTLQELEAVYDANFFSTSQQSVELDAEGNFTEQSQSWPIYVNSKRRVETIRRTMPSGRLLDVGCAKGFFLKVASEHFEVVGTDLSETACDYASNELGIETVAGDFLSVPLQENHFDIVTMWDVLASMPDPCSCLARVNTLLKDDGCLVFTVPDIGSLAFKITKHRWPLLIPPINLSYFTKNSVKNMLEQHGFELERFEHKGKLLSVNFIIRKLGRIFNIKALDSEKARLPFVDNLYLNLFDIATVYARKKSV